jgi:hypothetical protein
VARRSTEGLDRANGGRGEDRIGAQAIVAPAPSDPRLAAMLVEVSGRATESLVLLPDSEIELLRARSKGGALIENYAWRTIFASVPIVLALVYLKPMLGWLGNEAPSARTLTGLATLLTLAVSCVVVTAIWATLRRLDRDPGLFGLLGLGQLRRDAMWLNQAVRSPQRGTPAARNRCPSSADHATASALGGLRADRPRPRTQSHRTRARAVGGKIPAAASQDATKRSEREGKQSDAHSRNVRGDRRQDRRSTPVPSLGEEER